jgi:hypothetical protein
MTKRYREDGDTASQMKLHLDAIDRLMAVTAVGHTSDPYNLLENGVLLMEDVVEKEDDAGKELAQIAPVVVNSPISVTSFLRAELPETQRHIIPFMRTPFSSRLMSEKLAEIERENKSKISSWRMNRPQLQYFESDKPLMQCVLKEMDIDRFVEVAVERALAVLSDLRP